VACCNVSFDVLWGLTGAAAVDGRDAWLELEGFTGAELQPANNSRNGRRKIRGAKKAELLFIS
jgi:hypothetical protein